MFENSRFKHIFLSLVLSTAGSSIAMEQVIHCNKKSALTPEIITSITNAKKTLTEINVPEILRKAAADTANAKMKEEKAFTDAINNQNTLVGSVEINPNNIVNPVLKFGNDKLGKQVKERLNFDFPKKSPTLPNISLGIYKRDFIELIGFLTEIAADKMFFDKIQSERLNFIFNSIKNNNKDLVGILEKIAKDKEEFIKNYNQKSALTRAFINKAFELDILNKPLKEHLDQKQVYVTYKKLIKTELLLPMALNYSAKFSAEALENKLIYSTWKPRIIEEGFKKKADGTLEKTFTPSIISIFKMLWSPSKIGNVVIGNKKIFNFELINKYLNEINGKLFWKLPIPDFVYHKNFHYFTDFLKQLLTIKIFDQLYNLTWKSYLLEHQDEFYKILIKYNNATKEDVIKIDKELKEFINTGNSIKSWFSKILTPNSWQSQFVAQDRVNFYQRLPFILSTYWAEYKYFKYQITGSI